MTDADGMLTESTTNPEGKDRLERDKACCVVACCRRRDAKVYRDAVGSVSIGAPLWRANPQHANGQMTTLSSDCATGNSLPVRAAARGVSNLLNNTNDLIYYWILVTL